MKRLLLHRLLISLVPFIQLPVFYLWFLISIFYDFLNKILQRNDERLNWFYIHNVHNKSLLEICWNTLTKWHTDRSCPKGSPILIDTFHKIKSIFWVLMTQTDKLTFIWAPLNYKKSHLTKCSVCTPLELSQLSLTLTIVTDGGDYSIRTLVHIP